MDYLVMRLYAPLSAWGTLAVGEDRPTVSYPTRGAILGMLGAALGIKRTDTQRLQELSKSINFASKTYSTGTILRDYHTIQTPKSQKGVNFFTRKQELASDKIETILSSRDYREDGLWVVAIWLSPRDKRIGLTHKFDLEQLQSALLCPKFTLYIGRKSCPLSLPLSPKIVSTENLKTALDMDIIRSNNEDHLKQAANRGWGKINELVEQMVDDKWLPTNIVSKRPNNNGISEAISDNDISGDSISDGNISGDSISEEDSSSHSNIQKRQRLRQVTYHWEGAKDALFLAEDGNASNMYDTSNVYTHSHWDDPTNRQQWQFSQRVGHEWTTLEPVISLASTDSEVSEGSTLDDINDYDASLEQTTTTATLAGGLKQ